MAGFDPITSLDDLKGLKMRVPNVPLFVDVWSALGAQPTPMAFSEVFTSLQNGTIDAQENPLALIRSANFNEVQSHVNLTQHVRSWIYLVLAESTWARLSEQDRAIAIAGSTRWYSRSINDIGRIPEPCSDRQILRITTMRINGAGTTPGWFSACRSCWEAFSES